MHETVSEANFWFRNISERLFVAQADHSWKPLGPKAGIAGVNPPGAVAPHTLERQISMGTKSLVRPPDAGRTGRAVLGVGKATDAGKLAPLAATRQPEPDDRGNTTTLERPRPRPRPRRLCGFCYRHACGGDTAPGWIIRVRLKKAARAALNPAMPVPVFRVGSARQSSLRLTCQWEPKHEPAYRQSTASRRATRS
jgi:hypothetical protein